MNQVATAPSHSNTGHSNTGAEYAKAIGIAKQALGFIAQFSTPPTPAVYEVWYRYAEGRDDTLKERMEYAVNEAKAISQDELQQIRHDYCEMTTEDLADQQISRRLTVEISELQTLVASQLNANDDFNGSLTDACSCLRDESGPETTEGIQNCISIVLTNNEKMQLQLQSMTNRLETSKAEMDRLRNELVDSQRKLMKDTLTGVGSRRFFDLMMRQAIEDPQRGANQRFLLLVDLDKFKEINDEHGHAVGDRVLRYVASQIQRLAESASIARYGGDEFAIFLEANQLDEGLELADSLCSYFDRNRVALQESGDFVGNITTSIGGALLRPDDSSSDWFERADKLLYSAKSAGRNRAMVERKLR